MTPLAGSALLAALLAQGIPVVGGDVLLALRHIRTAGQADVDLRRLLKALLRGYGFRALHVEVLTEVSRE